MKYLLSALLTLALVLSCGPRACETCKGTGKISQSANQELPYEVIENKVNNMGVMNPDYYWTIALKNNGEKGGNFIISCDYIYTGIGTKTVTGELYVPAHETAKTDIRYDADNVANDFKLRIQAPTVVVTNESVCPTCNGKGLK